MALTRLMVLGIPGPSLGLAVFVDPDSVWSEIQEPTVEIWTEATDDTVTSAWVPAPRFP